MQLCNNFAPVMSVTKHQLIRYKILDQCFRNPGRSYFIEDLINSRKLGKL
jgi:hypothetical protein